MEVRDRRTAALANVNTNILGVVRGAVTSDHPCDFFCECGRANCHERVSLTIGAYSALRHGDGDGAVLAAGHDLSSTEHARRTALRLRDAAALRAQTEHQVNWAQKTRS